MTAPSNPDGVDDVGVDEIFVHRVRRAYTRRAGDIAADTTIALALPEPSRRRPRRRPVSLAIAASIVVVLGVAATAWAIARSQHQTAARPLTATTSSGLTVAVTSVTRAPVHDGSGLTCVTVTITVTNSSAAPLVFDGRTLLTVQLRDTTGPVTVSGTGISGSVHLAMPTYWSCALARPQSSRIAAGDNPGHTIPSTPPAQSLTPKQTTGPYQLHFRITGPAEQPLSLQWSNATTIPIA